MIDHFNYIIKNFELFYSYNNIKIGYRDSNSDINIIKNVNEKFWLEKNDIDYKNVVWKKWKGKNIPFLFDTNNEKDIITIEKNKITINYDIISSAFYFLSGWSEIMDKNKDNLGRVEFKNTIFNKLNITETPVVNYYFDILKEAIKVFSNKDPKINYWGEKKMAVVLTHDIDSCNSGWIEGSFNELKSKRIHNIPKLIFNRFFKNDVWFNFSEILNIEKKYGATSTFYFLPQKGKSEKLKNSDYDIQSTKLKNVISNIEESGCEIGVHGSFGTHNNSDKLSKDISRINSNNIIGNRFHFLMFDNDNTVNTLENSNLKYDSTMGFAEHIGFRRGICFPFFLFDFTNNKCSSILEIPLIVMDTTFNSKKYMNLSHNESFNKIKSIVTEIEKFNGVFTILWHNNYFSEYKYAGWKNVYIKTLDYCNENNGLLTNCRDIYTSIIKNEK